jgi:hypothetical protein
MGHRYTPKFTDLDLDVTKKNANTISPPTPRSLIEMGTRHVSPPILPPLASVFSVVSYSVSGDCEEKVLPTFCPC